MNVTKLKKIFIEYRALFLSAIFLLMWIGSMFYIFNRAEIKKQEYITKEMYELKNKYATVIMGYENFGKLIFQFLIAESDVPEKMWQAKYGDEQVQNKIRQEIYHDLSDMYKTLEQYNYRQLHFHTSDGRSFIRFHQPQKHGDLLTDVRDSIRIVSKEHRYISGFEEGRVFNGYRMVYPVFFNKEYVGSVEISIAASGIIKILRETFPLLYTNFLINEKVVNDIVWADEQFRYDRKCIIKGFLMDSNVEEAIQDFPVILDNETNLAILKAVNIDHSKDLENNLSFSDFVSVKKKDYLLGFLSISNISQKPVAYLVAISDNSIAKAVDENKFFISFIISIAFISIFVTSQLLLMKHIQLEDISEKDPLTGLYNRRRFFEKVKDILKNKPKTSSAVILDIDHFKRINDEFGHNTGDEVLVSVTKQLLGSIRQQDILARWGGEEFIVFLPDADYAIALQICERLRNKIETLEIKGVGNVTASFGFAVLENFNELEYAIQLADQAMYVSKQNGRNQVTYSKDLNKI